MTQNLTKYPKNEEITDLIPHSATSEKTEEAKAASEKLGDERTISEEFKISGDALVNKVKELIHQSNVRRIILKNEQGRILLEMPLNVGVIGSAIGAAVAPEIVALGVIGAMVAHLTVVVEREDIAKPEDR